MMQEEKPQLTNSNTSRMEEINPHPRPMAYELHLQHQLRELDSTTNDRKSILIKTIPSPRVLRRMSPLLSNWNPFPRPLPRDPLSRRLLSRPFEAASSPRAIDIVD
ncbi:hypothetical protein GWI33_002053 [Rhynchophorus ferrugineus]|uniref:Uncharacterized protein n=1 Tax=Rhynchophorus ferrugineus TaxID=354439 RepID=A0A834MPE5_RHYFE|nr:hypothetical protein GWI33_002053 [Rhynchophorus ferrugineus]